MKTVTIHYTETYEGDFDVEVNDDATEQDAINELTENPDKYHLGEKVQLTESDAEVVSTRNQEA